MGMRVLCAAMFLVLPMAANAGSKIPVVNEGGIRQAWTLPEGGKLAVPAYPEAYANNGGEVCVGVGYRLNADGTTSDFVLLKAWSADEPDNDRKEYWQAFANAASDALSHWKFVPREGVSDPKAVYTAATFLFRASSPAATSEKCRIGNLAQHIVDVRNEGASKPGGRNAQQIFSGLALDEAVAQVHQSRDRRRVDGQVEAHLEPMRQRAAENAQKQPTNGN